TVFLFTRSLNFRLVCFLSQFVLRVFFFFSSRSRHTSSKRDWSSDVCSSDLLRPRRHAHRRRPLQRRPGRGGTRARRAGGTAAPAQGRAQDRGRDEPVRRCPRIHHYRPDAGGEPAGGRPARPLRHVAGVPARTCGLLLVPQTAPGARARRCLRTRDRSAALPRRRRYRQRYGSRSGGRGTRHPRAHAGHVAPRDRSSSGSGRNPRRSGPPRARAGAAMKVLTARLDSMGDVLLAGPAVRAVAAHATQVRMLASPEGARAAELLPGVDEVLTWPAPWISDPAPDLTCESTRDLLEMVMEFGPDAAVIFTSFHQSPLPLAALLRLAGVPHITGASIDYAGSLLTTRLRPGEDFPEDQPEVLRALDI